LRITIEQAQAMMNSNSGNLNLSGTGITALPEGLTVGGSLYLSDTGITALPEGLTVGGSLDLSGTGIKRYSVKHFKEGDYKEDCYLYADGILTHVKKKKTVNGYTYFLGKIPNKNVIFDGNRYAHCADFRTGKKDLEYKAAKDRGADQYKGLPLDTKLSVDDLVTMYRVITGACQQGSQAFVESLGNKLKESYTIQEAIHLTSDQYGGRQFAEFFQVA